jgi:protein O-GlcNAc transferase
VPADRIVFGSALLPASHIKRLLVADLFLDSDMYGAHSTAVDALWAGVPVLTAPGDKLCSRVGASILHSMGLEKELVANSAEAFEARARELIGDPAALTQLRAKVLSRRSSPLFDIDLYVRGIELAYVQAYERYVNAEAPAEISIERTQVETNNNNNNGNKLKEEL